MANPKTSEGVVRRATTNGMRALLHHHRVEAGLVVAGEAPQPLIDGE